MINSRITYLIFASAFLLACSGCTSERIERTPAGKEMSLQYTRSDETDGPFVFLFWKLSDLPDIGSGTPPAPYHVAYPEGEIDDYDDAQSNPRYDTGKPYPSGNVRVAAVGYSPATLVQSQNYGVLSVPAGQGGILDIMASQPIYGVESNPFSETMEFAHLQSQVNFRAIRGPYMANYVKKVEVQVAYDGNFVEKITWDGTDYRYKVSNYSGSGSILTFGQDDDDPMLGSLPDAVNEADPKDYRDLGALYLTPGRTGMTITVKAQVAPPDAADIMDPQYTQTVSNVPVSFTVSNMPITLLAGDSYQVTLVFEYGGIELVGRKMDWKNGGNIVLPVPVKTTE